MLTKSNYLLGIQCPKLLWVAKNAKKRIPEPDQIAHIKFKVGEIRYNEQQKKENRKEILKYIIKKTFSKEMFPYYFAIILSLFLACIFYYSWLWLNR